MSHAHGLLGDRWGFEELQRCVDVGHGHPELAIEFVFHKLAGVGLDLGVVGNVAVHQRAGPEPGRLRGELDVENRLLHLGVLVRHRALDPVALELVQGQKGVEESVLGLDVGGHDPPDRVEQSVGHGLRAGGQCQWSVDGGSPSPQQQNGPRHAQNPTRSKPSASCDQHPLEATTRHCNQARSRLRAQCISTEPRTGSGRRRALR